jgi:hypothetical protein
MAMSQNNSESACVLCRIVGSHTMIPPGCSVTVMAQPVPPLQLPPGPVDQVGGATVSLMMMGDVLVVQQYSPQQCVRNSYYCT